MLAAFLFFSFEALCQAVTRAKISKCSVLSSYGAKYLRFLSSSPDLNMDQDHWTVAV